MAKITPYGDPEAHGSIGAFSFRRWMGKVIYEIKPHPIQPNTEAQLAQRLAFKNAVKDFYALNTESKLFYTTRASQLNLTPLALYVKMALLGILPSTTPFLAKSCTGLELETPRASVAYGILFSMYGTGEEQSMRVIWDNSLAEGPGSSYVDPVPAYIHIDPEGAETAHYAFRDLFRACLQKPLEEPAWVPMRLPDMLVDTDTRILYIASDGSLYWDAELTKLACTNNF